MKAVSKIPASISSSGFHYGNSLDVSPEKAGEILKSEFLHDMVMVEQDNRPIFTVKIPQKDRLW